MVSSNKQARLEQIRTDILQNNVCPDLAKQATQLVFGAGNVDAELVFVGEAPGKNEDVTGEPFVGAAGRFLDEMLESIKLERKDIYITNIVKYRPPDNRDPLPEEKAAFLPYLLQQIDTIQPKLIVTLGRHSMDVLLPGLKISQVHGQPQRINMRSSLQIVGRSSHSPANDELPVANYLEVVILPLYHPAAALYNGSLRQTLLRDFALIPDILKKI